MLLIKKDGKWVPNEDVRIGDYFEKLAKPIARALRLECLDDQGGLKPESDCAKRRDWLNKLGR